LNSQHGAYTPRLTEGRGDLTLELAGVLPAGPPVVFSALSDPEELAKWWGPHGFTAPSVEVDLRVGGSYRIAMQPPDGDLFHLSGEFCEVDPPKKLSYTFRWEEPAPDDQETVVKLTLRDLDGSTELRLIQGPFATEERLSLHRAGWTDAFEKLRELTGA
jgi:uncharacterized protein YndB with AHSA1/START domain